MKSYTSREKSPGPAGPAFPGLSACVTPLRALLLGQYHNSLIFKVSGHSARLLPSSRSQQKQRGAIGRQGHNDQAAHQQVHAGAGLGGSDSHLLPPRADAILQSAASIDGGPALTACDQNVCAGGGAPTFLDIDPAVGVLSSNPVTIGGVSVSFNVQTSVKSAGPGGLNTISSAGTAVQNVDTVAHTILFTIGDTDFIGPAFVFTATGSGTWVDQTLPAAFGGTTITMEWWNDPANTQGADSPGDTPGFLVNTATDTPEDGTSVQSFGGPVPLSICPAPSPTPTPPSSR